MCWKRAVLVQHAGYFFRQPCEDRIIVLSHCICFAFPPSLYLNYRAYVFLPFASHSPVPLSHPPVTSTHTRRSITPGYTADEPNILDVRSMSRAPTGTNRSLHTIHLCSGENQQCLVVLYVASSSSFLLSFTITS